MRKQEYIKYLTEKGYKILNETQVALGTIIFDIHESEDNTAMGNQKNFHLKINANESDLNLCPSPWN